MEPRVVAGHVIGPFQVQLTFADGSAGAVDLSSWVGGRGGVFVPLQEPEYFAQVAVDPGAGTIRWPNGVDLDADMLYAAAHNRPVRRTA
jgi:hypothetical protein